MSAPHIERMENEADELGDRINKLRAFRDSSPLYSTLTDRQRSLLAAQLQSMSCYKTILSLRIENERVTEEAA